MNNKKIVDTLITCGLEVKRVYKIESLYDTPIDIKYWLEKGKVYNLDKRFIIEMILDIIKNKYDNNKDDLDRFESLFDFLYSTFIDRSECIIDKELIRIIESTSFMENSFIQIVSAIGWSRFYGYKLKIDNEVLILIDTNDKNLKLVDKSGNVWYNNVIGIEKDLDNGKVKVVCDKVFDMEELERYDRLTKFSKITENKLRVSFYTRYGRYLW